MMRLTSSLLFGCALCLRLSPADTQLQYRPRCPDIVGWLLIMFPLMYESGAIMINMRVALEKGHFQRPASLNPPPTQRNSYMRGCGETEKAR
jgi:hypothetical protein